MNDNNNLIDFKLAEHLQKFLDNRRKVLLDEIGQSLEDYKPFEGIPESQIFVDKTYIDAILKNVLSSYFGPKAFRLLNPNKHLWTLFNATKRKLLKETILLKK